MRLFPAVLREAGWGVPFNATGMVKKRELQIFDVRNFQQKFKDYVQSRIRQELNLGKWSLANTGVF